MADLYLHIMIIIYKLVYMFIYLYIKIISYAIERETIYKLIY